MNRNTPLAALLALALSGCSSEPPASLATTATPEPNPADRFVARVEGAHGRDAWLAHPALASHIEVDFGSNTVLAGEMTFTTDMGRSRIDTADGSSLIWDGKTAWITPAATEMPMARFHVLTWPYFVLAPLKLRDPGAHLEMLEPRQIGERTYNTARLSFDSGVGDTPDDWYLLYEDQETSMLHAMAYIVTFGTTPDEAEKEPHAIVYEEHVDLDGASVPARMRFYMWTEEQGIHGDPIGELRIDSPRFLSPDPATFDVPADAREVPLPVPG